ncbi:MAG: ASKHA domain-containing protein [Candidatus Zipacnadales bacterium]
MALITFKPDNITLEACDGESLAVVAARAGMAVRSDCGGQGACRMCTVILESGELRSKEGAPLETGSSDAEATVLACQAVIAGDAVIRVPESSRAVDLTPFAKILGRAASLLEADRPTKPLVQRRCLSIDPPSKGDSIADVDRIFDALRAADPSLRHLSADLPTLRRLPTVLREADWQVCTTIVDGGETSQLVDIGPACNINHPVFGLAVDIGTSTVATALVSLDTGRVVATSGKRNGQIRFGDDVISRIIWSEEHPDGIEIMRQTVVQTLNQTIAEVRTSVGVAIDDIIAMSCAANSTMMNFLLGIPSGPIRRDPHTPPASWLPLFTAEQLELDIWSRAAVQCLPTVSGFVGADITAGVLATGMTDTDELSLLVDVGTNGEIVVAMEGMLVCASCSAGPAFEGVGIQCGMHGGPGAIEAVTYNPTTEDVVIHTIGNLPPLGICGTGFIDTLATLFVAGVIDRGGRFVKDFRTKRLRDAEHETEFVLVYEGEYGARRDIAIRQSDIENLVRSKAAVYAGISILLQKLHLDPQAIERLYLAGAFGSHLDVRQAVQIGMLPDLPPERVEYVGNTSLAGAHLCLVSRKARERIREIAAAMTYIELSVEPGFMEEYVASMFLPHTHTERFPSVVRMGAS